MIHSLPEKRNVLFLGILLLIIYLIFYNMIGNNASEHHTNYAIYIETGLDHQIPFIPSFIIIYLFTVIYPIIAMVYLVKKADISIHSFYRIYVATLVMITTCTIIWLIYPTKFMLRASDAELLNNGFWGSTISVAYHYITLWNAFPSFHIAIAWFIFRMMQIYSSKHLWLFQILFCAIAASTVFIRIHYVADILFGILIAEIASNIFLRNLEKYQVFSNLSRKTFIYSYVGILGILVGIFLFFTDKTCWIPS